MTFADKIPGRLKGSARLLLVLGLLFSIPIAAKTGSAHGVVPALATGLLVMFLVFMGPVSFFAAGLIETGFVAAVSGTTYLEALWISLVGMALFVVWLSSVARDSSGTVPYVVVTGWALMGAYFCVSVVFAHTT